MAGIINAGMNPLKRPEDVTDVPDANEPAPPVARPKPLLVGPADPGTGTGTTKPDPTSDPDPNPLARGSTTPALGPPSAAPADPNANPLARPGADTGTPGAGTPDAGTPPPAGSPGAATPSLPRDDSAGMTGGTGSSTGQNSSTAWTPTGGIVNQIQGITPKNVDSTGYTATDIANTPDATATGYDAQGYTAAQGTAQTSDESVSQAADRIINQNSPLMERARAAAAEQANERGLLNSSMAVGAGQAAVLDKATELATGDVQNAQFNAQQANVMTINNVQQANAASAFHAEATNQAAQFAAAAKNSVSQFNSAEAQQKAISSAQLWDQAAQFSAAAKQAADTFNAAAYNDAMQHYTDAKNAAVAAQNDAENLSKRDTAQINAALEQSKIGAAATVGAASQHAAGMVASAQIGAAASAANTDAMIKNQQFMQTQSLNQDMSKFNASMSQQQQQWAGNLSAGQFNQFQNGLTNIMTSPLEPDAKAAAIQNYLSVWSASGTLPFNVTPPPS